MTEEVTASLSTRERKRLAFEQTTEAAKAAAEAEKKARDEKTSRLRAVRIASKQAPAS
jgi:hypothetical protein